MKIENTTRPASSATTDLQEGKLPPASTKNTQEPKDDLPTIKRQKNYDAPLNEEMVGTLDVPKYQLLSTTLEDNKALSFDYPATVMKLTEALWKFDKAMETTLQEANHISGRLIETGIANGINYINPKYRVSASDIEEDPIKFISALGRVEATTTSLNWLDYPLTKGVLDNLDSHLVTLSKSGKNKETIDELRNSVERLRESIEELCEAKEELHQSAKDTLLFHYKIGISHRNITEEENKKLENKYGDCVDYAKGIFRKLTGKDFPSDIKIEIADDLGSIGGKPKLGGRNVFFNSIRILNTSYPQSIDVLAHEMTHSISPINETVMKTTLSSGWKNPFENEYVTTEGIFYKDLLRYEAQALDEALAYIAQRATVKHLNGDIKSFVEEHLKMDAIDKCRAYFEIEDELGDRMRDSAEAKVRFLMESNKDALDYRESKRESVLDSNFKYFESKDSHSLGMVIACSAIDAYGAEKAYNVISRCGEISELPNDIHDSMDKLRTYPEKIEAVEALTTLDLLGKSKQIGDLKYLYNLLGEIRQNVMKEHGKIFSLPRL